MGQACCCSKPSGLLAFQQPLPWLLLEGRQVCRLQLNRTVPLPGQGWNVAWELWPQMGILLSAST